MPWPTFARTFVWRDTTMVNSTNGSLSGMLGGTNANGVDPDIFCAANLFTMNPATAATTVSAGAFVPACDFSGAASPGNPSPNCDPGNETGGTGGGCQNQVFADWSFAAVAPVNLGASKPQGIGWPPGTRSPHRLTSRFR